MINSSVILPGRDLTSLILILKDGWKYPLATKAGCIIQSINAALRFDKSLSVLFVQKMLLHLLLWFD